MNIYTSTLIFLICSVSLSCKSPKIDAGEASKTVEAQVATEAEDCYYPRKTIRTLIDEIGTIIEVDGNFLIDADSRGRYFPCEVPNEYRKEGLKVLFTGDKLELFPNERLMGTPLRLKSIQLENK